MVIFVIVCLSMILIILLQSGKSEGLSGIFGGAGMQNVFGGRGAATFLSKLTTGLAVSFIVLSLILAKFYGSTGASPELKKEEAAETQIAPEEEKTTEEATGNIESEKSERTTTEEDKTE